MWCFQSGSALPLRVRAKGLLWLPVGLPVGLPLRDSLRCLSSSSISGYVLAPPAIPPSLVSRSPSRTSPVDCLTLSLQHPPPSPRHTPTAPLLPKLCWPKKREDWHFSKSLKPKKKPPRQRPALHKWPRSGKRWGALPIDPVCFRLLCTALTRPFPHCPTQTIRYGANVVV